MSAALPSFPWMPAPPARHEGYDVELYVGYATGQNLYRQRCSCGHKGMGYSCADAARRAHESHVARETRG